MNANQVFNDSFVERMANQVGKLNELQSMDLSDLPDVEELVDAINPRRFGIRFVGYWCPYSPTSTGSASPSTGDNASRSANEHDLDQLEGFRE